LSIAEYNKLDGILNIAQNAAKKLEISYQKNYISHDVNELRFIEIAT
jgi:hypothetical protein